MNHPWEEIRLEDYEQHMLLDSVGQLRALNTLMKDQLGARPVRSVMILGIAGGNGLEHIRTDQCDTVWGIDINKSYLRAAEERYPELEGILHCLCLDLAKEPEKLPKAELVIADLLVEYIGYDAFLRAVRQVDPAYVSCVIQIDTDEAQWVSDSPYLHAFDRLDEVHCRMEESMLNAALEKAGYEGILRDAVSLPNGKQFVRLDYKKKTIRK